MDEEIQVKQDFAKDVIYQKRFWNKQYRRISFDVLRLNILRIKDIYNIPYGEDIMAYCKSPSALLGISFGGIVFTDKAIYPHPNSIINNMPSRIPYINLGRYFVVQSSERGSVALINDKNDYEIFGERIFFKNEAGNEIVDLLVSIQNAIIAQSDVAAQTLNCIAQRILEEGKTIIQNDELKDKVYKKVYALLHYEPYRNEAAYLVAENSYRLCDEESYKKFINNLNEEMFCDIKSELISVPDMFKEKYVNDLLNLSISFSTDFEYSVLTLPSARTFPATLSEKTCHSVGQPCHP